MGIEDVIKRNKMPLRMVGSSECKSIDCIMDKYRIGYKIFYMKGSNDYCTKREEFKRFYHLYGGM